MIFSAETILKVFRIAIDRFNRMFQKLSFVTIDLRLKNTKCCFHMLFQQMWCNYDFKCGKMVSLGFQKYFKFLVNCCFCTMNFEFTCFKIGFRNCILKFCDIHLNSNYFFNQNTAQEGLKKFWGIFVVHNVSEKVFSTWSIFKKNDIIETGKC